MPEASFVRSATAVSTGPRTVAGKLHSSKNAIKHGLLASSPVLPGEDPRIWEMYRREIITSLSPTNFLEREIAETVARLWWKRRRLFSFNDMREQGIVDEIIQLRDSEQFVIELRERCDTLHQRIVDTRRHLLLVLRVLPLNPTSKLDNREVQDFFELVMMVCEAEVIKECIANEDFLEVAGYSPGTTSEDQLDAVPIYDDFTWTRRHLDKGLRYIAKQEKASVSKLLDSLPDKIDRLIKTWQRELGKTRSDLIRSESELFQKNLPTICKQLLAENGVVNTIHRTEVHTTRQITLALKQLASLREIGLVSSNPTINREQRKKSEVGSGNGGTATEIDELSAHECKDNGVFNTAKLQPEYQEVPLFAG
jgi:hypothetical protein